MTFISQYRTSSTHTSKSTLVRLVAGAREWIAEQANRQRMRVSLGRLSERHLKDIGLADGDILNSLNAPMAMDASKILEDARSKRAGNW